MMNKWDLPDWLVTVIERTRASYSSGNSDFTATSLLKPPLIYALEKEHEFEEDAADNLASLDGTALHNCIEHQLTDDPRYLVEHRFYRTVHVPNAPGKKKNFIISAQIDVYDKETKVLWDSKRSKIFKWIKGNFYDYEAQMNIQRFLMKEKYEEPEEMKIAFFPKDHDRNKAKWDKDYPDVAFTPIDIPKWHDDDVVDFIRTSIVEKLYALRGHKRLCTPEERWQRPSAWAVMRKGRKSAIRVFDTEGEAEDYLKSLTNDLTKKVGGEYIEHRPGEDVRCTGFCPVSQHCSYFQENYGGS